jgi:hypothetical protein
MERVGREGKSLSRTTFSTVPAPMPGINIDLCVTLLFQSMKLPRTSFPLGR